MEAPAPHASVRLELLGATTLVVDGAPVAIRSRKSRAVLAFLALAPHHRASRAQLAGTLWSDGSDENARVSLRQQLQTLKRELGGAAALVQSDRQEVWLNPPISIDAAEALREIERHVVPEALTQRKDIADGYLSDVENVDPTFDYWLAVQRESFSEALLQKLRLLMLQPASPVEAERAAIAVHNLDASNEEACRVLMRSAVARGDVAGALRIYNELWDLLDRDFDMEPSAETQAFVAEIKSQPTDAAPPPQARAEPDGHILILVSSFDHDGITPEQERRVNGLRHELIGALTRFRDWSVREAGRPLSDDDLARHKTYEISALASAEGDEVFISLVLRRHDDGTYLWSQRVSVQLEQWVSAKLDIIRKIATSLEVHLSAERVSQTAGEADHRLDVYDRWLRGKSLTSHWQPEAEQRAEEIFRSLIKDAPNFPLSYVGVAQILTTRHHIFPGILRNRSGEEEALRHAKTAVKLDPRDSRTQLCLAWSHIMVDNFEQAIFSYDLAIQLNDNDPWTLTSCAQGLSYCNEKERARKLADRALDVAVGGAPMHWSYQMCVRFLDEDYDAALKAADQAEGSAFFVPAWKAAALHFLGQPDAARETIRQFRHTVSNNWHGSEQATPAAIERWLMQCFPIRLKADRERLAQGVLGAGLLETD